MATKSQVITDFRKLSQKELADKLHESKLKLAELKSQVAIGKLKQFSELKKLKRNIARMETAKSEKLILQEVEVGKA